ncbi:MAG TPA: serine/threonine-protein kinase, partial [Byssovorax sp.]
MTPRRIGPYAVLRELGARAFTVTYRAEQPRLGRTVLVRALKPTVDESSPFAEELAREAAVLARLDHPGVVRLFEFVESKEASYLVLEDVNGAPLPALTHAIKLTADQAAAITLDVARALGHAHERGFVHRALRPSVVELREGGAARVVDFSHATTPRAESLPEPIEVGEPPEHARGTVAARAAAAAAFVAPEQILGEPLDARADVWSLGALFYTLAAGTPPFV